MTAMFRAAAPCAFLATLVAGPIARAQMQPPPFDSSRSAAPVPPVFVDAPPHRSPPPAPQQRPQPQPLSDDDFDDPKVFRRLGTRISVPPPRPSAPPGVPVPVVRPAIAKPSPPPAPQPTPVAAPAPEMEGAGVPAIERPYTPVAEAPFEPTLPRLKLGLRRFQFVRIGASSSPDGVAEPETFNNLSVDVYPVSRTIRIGLTSAFGWQSGTWLDNGDYFATQTVSLGAQYRDLGRIVPFAEGYAGVGYMRRLQFDRTIPTAFWQFGADVGAEVYVARVGYLSFAVGYMRPVNGFAKRQQFTSVFVDTWSFKIGIGI
jgi:hypothetical protein